MGVSLGDRLRFCLVREGRKEAMYLFGEKLKVIESLRWREERVVVVFLRIDGLVKS